MPGTMLSPRRIPLARLDRGRHLVSMESAGRGEGTEHASPLVCGMLTLTAVRAPTSHTAGRCPRWSRLLRRDGTLRLTPQAPASPAPRCPMVGIKQWFVKEGFRAISTQAQCLQRILRALRCSVRANFYFCVWH